MKSILTFLLLLTYGISSFGQIQSPENIQPDSTTFKNVYVKSIHSSNDASVFVIWIKKEVPNHRHDAHTEVVFVLEGKGKMQLGGNTSKIKKGDIIVIPQGSPHSVIATSKKPLKVLSVQSPNFDGSDRIWIK